MPNRWRLAGAGALGAALGAVASCRDRTPDSVTGPAPNVDLLVSNPGAGKVSLVRPGAAGGDPVVTDWATGLYKPHDVVFHAVGGQILRDVERRRPALGRAAVAGLDRARP